MEKKPLLDLGNVVVRVDFRPFLAWLESRSAEAHIAKIGSFLTSSLFFEFEFGAISTAGFLERTRSLYGAHFHDEEFIAAFCAIFPGLVTGMEELLGELAADGAVYALSNTNEVHLRCILDRYPVMQKFTKVFASHEMKMRKPYPGIYQAVAEELGAAPAELVFFDDVAANVEGARRAGLEGHLFSEAAQVRELLKNSKDTVDEA